MPHTSTLVPAQANSAATLEKLRANLKAAGFAGFIVPKSDEFQNESVPPHADRLTFLTGFSGSAGTAVILMEKAALIVDSRYTLQGRAQTDPALYDIEVWPKKTVSGYLADNVKPNDIIGYDARLHTVAELLAYQKVATASGFTLQGCATNPIDAIWDDRPSQQVSPIMLHDLAFTGETVETKLARVREAVAKKDAAGVFVAAADSVAWLFNIRGRDVAHTPVALVRAFIPAAGQPILFVSDGHVTPDVKPALEAVATLCPIESIKDSIKQSIEVNAKIMIDPARTTLAIAQALEESGALPMDAPDPCVPLKAQKNPVECAGARAAHKRDGVALCRFLAWLDATGRTGDLDEIGAAARLGSFRREGELFEGESFDTISGAGPNGAIVHYRVTPATNRKLASGSLFLIDSGGQYRDGTTDVTRTIAIGTPTPDMCRHFTLVLKGHIALSTARFPVGARGVDLDAFARRSLWAAGLDYGHGTGHGVGSFLSVHEGPQGFSRNNLTAFEPGMIVSNEPGYYREGHYGIRVENLLLVKEAEVVNEGEIAMLSFETLTLAPMDRAVIDTALLSHEEIAWLNAYHARVYGEIAPALSVGEREWLARATASL